VLEPLSFVERLLATIQITHEKIFVPMLDLGLVIEDPLAVEQAELGEVLFLQLAEFRIGLVIKFADARV
jgi:hypothetical protein